MLSDQELAALLEAGSKTALDCGCGCPGEPGVMPGCDCTTCVARRALAAQAPDLAEELIKLREVLRLWNDHLPGCSGSPRCECGYAEARALLEVPDGD